MSTRLHKRMSRLHKRISRYFGFALILFFHQTDCGVGGESLLATRVATGLSRPIFAASPPGDSERLFIAEQHTGRIRILDLTTGTIQSTPFLDLSGLSTGSEQGLLGLAFHPNYAANGTFYINMTESSGRTSIRSYQTSADDPNRADTTSAQTLLQINQPEGNHNGGWMGFSPNDGYLYIATGDGGGSNDRHGAIGNGQDITNNLLGKMLRIDVNSDDFPVDANRNYSIPPSNPFVGTTGDDEIWSYGLRNPWRSSFDRQTGDLYIADVGQGQREEIDFQPSTSPGGENYGWRLREGTIATPGVGGNRPDGAVDPIHDYVHDSTGGFSVTGGYVYRGPLTELDGQYFFADFVTNNIWSLEHDGTNATNVIDRNGIVADEGTIGSISSFGEDDTGNLYIVSLDGDIFRIDDVVQTAEIVPSGAVWRYLDDGSDQGTNWFATDFDDSSWSQGAAQLGYGDDDETTVVRFGPDSSDKHITTYFRHEFEIDNVTNFESLQLGLVRDDGGAVYLNGVEVARTDNLAPNAGFDTPANFNNAPATSGAAEDTFFPFTVDANILVPGRNVLAVEIHQRSATSSDISFDLRLSATIADVLLSCDFNDDRLCDVTDVDLLTAAADLQAGAAVTPNTTQFDLDANGIIDVADLTIWRRTAGNANGFSEPFQRGDANLDGTVNAIDLNALGLRWLQSNAVWSGGDFNGDGVVDATDLNLMGLHWQQSVPLAASVPEPSAHILISLLLASGLLWLRASRSS